MAVEKDGWTLRFYYIDDSGLVPVAFAAPFPVTIHSFESPMAFHFFTYSGSVPTYINRMFDNNFEHVPGDIEKHLFKMKDFRKDRDDIVSEMIFRYKGAFFMGGYSEDTESYSLWKFQE
ncbi:hypothetical protein [Sinomicrobium oceani]|uniref:hypothetical protein n=1 Tax=Sinomicrobium oceani TaxID=1150368 RepID=UPI00227AF426|nr:hypothetical protein [Sinomicrobium oceani]